MERHDTDLVETVTLKAVRIGSDRINFKILRMVGYGMEKGVSTKIEDVMEEIGLSKVPVNNRINQLEKAGLVKRLRGTGLVLLTDFGKDFMMIINRGEKMIEDRLVEMLNRMSSHDKY